MVFSHGSHVRYLNDGRHASIEKSWTWGNMQYEIR
jgi:hypothetical protein